MVKAGQAQVVFDICRPGLAPMPLFNAIVTGHVKGLSGLCGSGPFLRAAGRAACRDQRQPGQRDQPDDARLKPVIGRCQNPANRRIEHDAKLV